MIINLATPLLCAANPLHFNITLPNGNRAAVERTMSDGKLRLLMDCGLAFKVPMYANAAQLAALTAHTADREQAVAA